MRKVLQIAGRPPIFSDDALLDAAAEVFHARGFHEASMVDIAAAAGATKPTLYARFGTKDQLYDRVLERTAESLIAEFAVPSEATTAHEATQRLAERFFGWVRAHPAGFGLLFADGHGAPAGIVHRERALHRLTDVITEANTAFLRRRGQRPGRATGLLAAYFVGLLHHGALWAVEHDALERLDVSGFTGRFILGGIEAVSPDGQRSVKL